MIKYFHPLTRLIRQQKKLLTKPLPEQIKRNLSYDYIEEQTALESVSMLVLDIETTGLDAEQDQILSLGWVEINNLLVDLSTCQHLYISDATGINSESAVINHITPEHLESGLSRDEAFSLLLHHMQGKVMVAHGSMVEKAFIDRFIQEKYQLSSLPLIWLDTLSLEKNFAHFRGEKDSADFRLSSVRNSYGLPEYATHDALTDAVSCAELLLVQIERYFSQDPRRIFSLYPMAQNRHQ